MNKPIKIILIVIGLIILLPIVAAVIATQVIDTDDIKQLAADQVAKQTGRELTIDGDIDLSVFPWLSIDLGHTRLSNAPGFGPEPMLEVDQISVSLKILPLLRGSIEMDTVTLAGLKADLQINAEGISNYDDLAGDTVVENGATNSTSPSNQTADGAALAAFALGGIEITDARIHWRDQTSQTDILVSDLDLVSGAIAAAKPVDIAFGATLVNSEPALEIRIDASFELNLDDNFEQIGLQDLVVEVAAMGDSLPGGKLNSRLAANAAIDMATDQITVEQLALTLLGIKLGGNLAVAQFRQSAQVSTTLDVEPFNAQELLASLAMPAIETADDNVLKNISASLKISANENQATLSELTIQLDQTQLEGNASVTEFDDPAIAFRIAIDAIDLDRYLPPTNAESASPAEPAAGASSEEPLNLGESLAGLAALNLDGSLTIGELKISNIKTTDLLLKVKASKGHLILNPMSANLYDGSLKGSVDVNGATQPPTLAVKQSLTGVELAPLLKDAAGITQLSGTANIQADIATRGNLEAELTQALNGTLGFEITGGTLEGINIDRSACLARQGLRSLKGDGDSETCPADEPTRFTSFRANAKITNGVLKNNDLFIEQQRSDPDKFLHIKGAGIVDLNLQSIDYRVTAGGVEKLADGSYKNRGTAIPVRITGSLAEPSVAPDVSSLIKDKAKTKLMEKLVPKLAPDESDSPKNQLKKRLLRGLFN